MDYEAKENRAIQEDIRGFLTIIPIEYSGEINCFQGITSKVATCYYNIEFILIINLDYFNIL